MGVTIEKKVMLTAIDSESTFSDYKFSVMRRIIHNVEVVEKGHDTACWEWQGGTSGDSESTRGHGYGRISVHGHMAAVHRVMWSLVHGYLPAKKQIDHKCKNRLCCNPQHLQMVTHKQNQKLRDKRS